MNIAERVGEEVVRRIAHAPTLCWEDGITWVDLPAMKIPLSPGEMADLLRAGGHQVEVVKNGAGEAIGWMVSR